MTKSITGQYEYLHRSGVGLDYFTSRIDRLTLQPDGRFILTIQERSRIANAAQSFINGQQIATNAPELRRKNMLLPHLLAKQINRHQRPLLSSRPHPLPPTLHLTHRCRVPQRLLNRRNRKPSSVINVAHALDQEKDFVIIVALSYRSPFIPSHRWLFPGQVLICSYDALHLLLISPTIGMITFRQCSIATFNLLWSGIWRQTQHIQGLLALHKRTS